MTKRPLAAIALTAALLLAVMGACGGGSSAKRDQSGNHAPAAFRALAEKAQRAEYRLDYTLIGPKGEVRETGTSYRKPSKFRLDRVLAQGDSRVAFTTIWGGGQVVECSEGAGGEWSCASRAGEDEVDGLPILLKSPEGFRITEKEGRTVAGQLTACFLAVPAAKVKAPYPEEIEVCLSEDGVVLFQRTKRNASGEEAETIRQATSYSNQVDDSDFEPPAEAPS